MILRRERIIRDTSADKPVVDVDRSGVPVDESTPGGRRERVVDEPAPVVRQERVVDPPAVVRTERVVSSPSPGLVYVPSAGSRLAGLILAVAGVVSVILLGRFLLLLFGANPHNAFASLVMSLSAPLVAPFRTLFAAPPYGNGIVEYTDLIAIAMYYLLAGILARFVTVLFGAGVEGY